MRRARSVLGPSLLGKAVIGVTALGVAVLGLTGCGSSKSVGSRLPQTLRVPQQFKTIQAAVSHARPGDLVLVSPGTYREAVTITTPDVDLRGLDRNRVILDGGDNLPNGVTASAPGDVVENLTARHYAINGVLFTKAGYNTTGSTSSRPPVLQGYRASYVTAYDNGLYGIYAFAATGGQVDHVLATGQPDSGIYIGQCSPCHALVTDDVGQGNRVGFEAANASGELSVVHSTWSGNRAGVTVESSTEEQLAPQHGALVAANTVSGNDNPQTPTQDLSTDVFGYGIVIGGGSDDTVENNRVTGNPTVGVLVTTLGPAQGGYAQARNTVKGNVASSNGLDLAFSPAGGGAVAVGGTCFGGNTFASSLPPAVEGALPCAGGPASLTVTALPSSAPPAGVDYSSLPAPAAAPSMPAAATAPARAAVGLGAPPAPASLTVPAP